MWTPIDGRGVTVTELAHIIEDLQFPTWKPSGGVLHCTGAPNLKQALSTPPQQRIKNLEQFFKVEHGWSSGPHAFVWPDKIWLFTPLNMRGTHSPSWNGTRFGVEMMGNYNRDSHGAIIDDPTTGDGLRVYKNAVALFGLMYAKIGADPDNVKMHRDDPLTTHKDCPGSEIDGGKFIRDVHEFMGVGGDLDYSKASAAPSYAAFTRTPGDTLNMRAASSASSPVVSVLKDGTPITVLSEAMNGATKWLRIRTGAGVEGWCAARFTKEG